MKTPTKSEWQAQELRLFNAASHPFFESTKDFAEWLESTDLDEQITWIENGSYGAGACFALQQALASVTPRANGNARVGSVILRAFYGAPFTQWKKLPETTRTRFDAAVSAFRNRTHDFATTLEP